MGPPMRSSRRPSGRPVSFSAALLLGGAVQVAVALAFAGDRRARTGAYPAAWGSCSPSSPASWRGPWRGSSSRWRVGPGSSSSSRTGALGGWVAVVLWIVAAGVAGAIADRYRETGHERDIAHASERRARQAAESESARLAHLHNLTGRLADAITVRDVCGALVDTAIGSLGADASGVALLSPTVPSSSAWRPAGSPTTCSRRGPASRPMRRSSRGT